MAGGGCRGRSERHATTLNTQSHTRRQFQAVAAISSCPHSLDKGADEGRLADVGRPHDVDVAAPALPANRGHCRRHPRPRLAADLQAGSAGAGKRQGQVGVGVSGVWQVVLG